MLFDLQYYNRWANHEQSAKLSLDLYAKTEKKMEDMQISSALTWIEVGLGCICYVVISVSGQYLII
jgi:ariadne-1